MKKIVYIAIFGGALVFVSSCQKEQITFNQEPSSIPVWEESKASDNTENQRGGESEEGEGDFDEDDVETNGHGIPGGINWGDTGITDPNNDTDGTNKGKGSK